MDELLFFGAFEELSVIFETFIVYQYIYGLFEIVASKKKSLFCFIFFGIGLGALSIYVQVPLILITYWLVFRLELSLRRMEGITSPISCAY